MKKYILTMLAAAAVLTSCDPQIDSKDWSGHKVSADELKVNTKQYNLNEDGTYSECADGNYIEFSTTPSTVVEVYYVNAKGVEMNLSKGKANGMMVFVPARGSEPQQTLYFRTHEYDGSSVTVSKEVTVQVATDLAPEMKLICSNAGEKVWEWGPDENGRVWGNAGNAGGAWDGSSIWWGCGPIGGTADGDFSGQMQHSSTGNVEETELGAYMVFSEDGSVTKFSKDGAKICSGKFEITDWTGGEQTDWVAGKLNVTDGAVLFPFAINTGGKVVESFNLSILTADKMVLTYYENDPGSWGETTWWSFESHSDALGMLTDNDEKSWGWGPDENGRVWGNAGNAGGAWDGSSIWWGCGPIGGTADGDFSGQMQHSSTGNVEETELGAYMTFTADGAVTKYSKDGAKIGSGSFEILNYSANQENWKYGTLKVTDGAVLFPFFINSGGTTVENFNISKLSSEKMILTYYENDPGSWGETTWWSFEKK